MVPRSLVSCSCLALSLLSLSACKGDPQPAAGEQAVAQALDEAGKTDPATPAADAPPQPDAPKPPPEIRFEPPAPAPLPEAPPDEAEDEDAEPPPYPEQTTPDPPAFVHPSADTVIVVASNRSFSPGDDGVDRDSKYHSFIWRPSLGPLPEGKLEAPPAGEPAPAPLVQEIEGLILADGEAMWQAGVSEVTVSLPKCECDEISESAAPGRQKLAKKLYQLEVQPFVDGAASGEPKVLIGAENFVRKSGQRCIADRDAVEHVLQVAAVADGRLFVVERVRDVPACDDEISEGYEQRSQRILDMRSGLVAITDLENELSYRERKNARNKASEALGESSELSPARLAPAVLELVGLFPTYREYKGGVRLLMLYAAPVSSPFGTGGWGNLYDATKVTIAYPESSSLTAPAEAMALISYVHRNFSNWKVIGWSQVDGGQPSPAPAGPAPANPAPANPAPANPAP